MASQELSRHYYSYHGSLTTPPYNECVTWIIYQAPVFVAHSQVRVSYPIHRLRNVNTSQLFVNRLKFSVTYGNHITLRKLAGIVVKFKSLQKTQESFLHATLKMKIWKNNAIWRLNEMAKLCTPCKMIWMEIKEKLIYIGIFIYWSIHYWPTESRLRGSHFEFASS